MAEEEGFEVEVDGFNCLMEEQRERARSGGHFSGTEQEVCWETVSSGPHSQFIGDQLEARSALRMMACDDQYWRLVFAATPFYAAGGGQVGDTGLIRVEVTPGVYTEFTVVDTQREQEKVVHVVEKKTEFPRQAIGYTLQVTAPTRKMAAANHTATHLLHAALRRQLGTHLHQAGSLVSPERLRFDFTHYQRVDEDQLRKVEREVNQQIFAALSVEISESDYQSALDQGALAFFGEKYGDRVRTVKIGDYSMELCGGTHVSNTAEIMTFRIISEGSVATGVRRIEAVTGWEALQLAAREKNLLQELATLLQTEPNQLKEKVSALMEAETKHQKELEAIKRQFALAEGEEIFTGVQEHGGHSYLVAKMTEASMDLLRENVDRFKDKFGSGVILLGAIQGEKVNFVAGVSKDLTAKIQAGTLVKQVAAIADGGGGGRPELAQAGGKNTAKLEEALCEGERLIRASLE
jgi:alanyl-tRNA synthetase